MAELDASADPGGLRKRSAKGVAPSGHASSQDGMGPTPSDASEEVVWGKTPSGQVFKVPATHSFVHTLSHTLFSSTLTLLTIASLLAQPLAFVYLPASWRGPLFLAYFAFWRGAYDLGLGWVLRRQSERRWIVRVLRAWGWLETGAIGEKPKNTGEAWARWWKRELEAKLGNEGYRWDEVPAEFNAWLMFRQLVDVILLNDFLSYSLFAIANLHFPPNHSVLFHISRWILGWSLIAFNLWVKIDAHRVVKDYAWYWGDAFWLIVQQKDLVFDGVYEIAPHPMYSVGYAGYYGLSIVTGSYAVFFASLVAHAAQFAFLLWFENPHIERTYGGGKKPLASRQPLHSTDSVQSDSPTAIPTDADPLATPSQTEGETEDEGDLVATPVQSDAEHEREMMGGSAGKSRKGSVQSSAESRADGQPFTRTQRQVSLHDLANRYFRKPVVVFSRIDMFRATDFTFVLLVTYALLPTLLHNVISPSGSLSLALHFMHALAWRLFHSFGLGLLLRAQSRSKWAVRHFLKHYHYPSVGDGRRMSYGQMSNVEDEKEEVVQAATEEAFANWKSIYNVSLVMTYVSFISLAWKIYSIPHDWTVSGLLLRHILGVSLVALHIWAATEAYEVLGDFGWLYSDFFLLDQYPRQLAYTGIYRFLNNPERSMGGAAFLGLSLISGSYLVATLAVVSHLAHWWFLTFVESPHMKKLYGDRLRKDGGLTKTFKQVASKHVRSLETRAGRHAPELKRVVSEVRGRIDKVEEKVTEAVEEFLQHARPKFNEVVQDTKFLLQQSRERMIITRVASDMTAYDATQYHLTLPSSSSSSQTPKYRLGQPITVSWTAPANHSHKDWIGIYRLGSCKSQLVTRISSMGKWKPLYAAAWDGDEPVELGELAKGKEDAGTVVFEEDALPWQPGQYELRLHHDGKHNVMTRLAPLEICVADVPKDIGFAAAHETLLDMVTLALDSEDKLIPKAAAANKRRQSSAGVRRTTLEDRSSAGTPRLAAQQSSDPPQDTTHNANVDNNDSPGAESPESGDADDFTIMTESQAKRITSMIELTFGVELSQDVVIADANVATLTRRVLGARSLLQSPDSKVG